MAESKIQFAIRRLDQTSVGLFDVLDRQPRASLAPRRIGEVLAGQMSHRRAGDVAVSDLLNEQPERAIRRELTHPRRSSGRGELIVTRQVGKIV